MIDAQKNSRFRRVELGTFPDVPRRNDRMTASALRRR
jgi:hypothetical protein